MKKLVTWCDSCKNKGTKICLVCEGINKPTGYEEKETEKEWKEYKGIW